MWKLWLGLAGMAGVTVFAVYQAIQGIRECFDEGKDAVDEKRWKPSTIMAVSLLIAALLMAALLLLVHRFGIGMW
jgi:hypothetical protein